MTISLGVHTLDLSEKRLTLLLHSVSIGGRYLTDKDSYLGVKLELPSGPVALLAASVRFEQLSKSEAGLGYLLGVRIIKMQNGDRNGYRAYLSTLMCKERRAREQRQVYTASPAPKTTEQADAWENLTPASVNKAFEEFLGKNAHSGKL